MAVLDRAVLEFLANQAVRANGAAGKVAVEPLNNYGFAHEIGVTKADGSFEVQQIPAPVRDYTVTAISEIIPVCDHLKNVLGATPVLWIAPTGVVVKLHDNDESKRWGDTASLNFEPTEQYQMLQRGIVQQTQKDFLRTLRQKFFPALGETATTLLPALKAISFKNGIAGKSVVGQGRESMGREIEQEVISSVGNIPEMVELTFSLYKDPSISIPQKIVCDLEVDAVNQTFSLTPLSGELDNAALRVRDHLLKILSGGSYPVFLGMPE